MGTLYISEYSHMATAEAAMGPPYMVVQIPQEPGTAEQTVDFSLTPVESKPFNDRTRFVRISTDVMCLLDFGSGPKRMVGTDYFGVVSGRKLTVVEAT
jgi:hypothetical protein